MRAADRDRKPHPTTRVITKAQLQEINRHAVMINQRKEVIECG